MAYSNWGAFVHRNGERRKDKEDVGVFDTDKSTLPSGWRIVANLVKNRDRGNDEWYNHSHHAVLGDGPVRLCGYKMLPELWVWKDDKAQRIELKPYKIENGKESWEGIYEGEIDGYKFKANQFNGNMVELWLQEPDGAQWQSTCGYCYGAGLMD